MNEIKIACTGAGMEDYKELIDLQDRLKERTEGDIKNATDSILKHGWSFPFFVWIHKETKYILDGHRRKEALQRIEARGITVPLLPAAYIHAESMKEARIKLLILNARYGALTEAGYKLFTKDMSSVELEGVTIKFDVPRQIKVDATDYTENREKINDFGDVEIVLPCPECLTESAYSVKELLELMEG